MSVVKSRGLPDATNVKLDHNQKADYAQGILEILVLWCDIAF